jgi:hypothetical protein
MPMPSNMVGRAFQLATVLSMIPRHKPQLLLPLDFFSLATKRILYSSEQQTTPRIPPYYPAISLLLFCRRSIYIAAGLVFHFRYDILLFQKTSVFDNLIFSIVFAIRLVQRLCLRYYTPFTESIKQITTSPFSPSRGPINFDTLDHLHSTVV